MSTVQQRGLATAETAPPATVDTRVATLVVSASNSIDPTLAPVAYRCTGVADEVEIQAAIAAVNAGGGGTVVLLEGTYNLAATITGATEVSLLGMGVATILMAGVGIGNAIQYTSVNNFSIGRMQIDTKTEASTGHCIALDACVDVLIFEIYIPDSDDDGIWIDDASGACTRITVAHCTILGADSEGIFSDATHTLLYGNYVLNTGASSFYLEAEYPIVVGNVSDTSGANGIRTQATYALINGNYVEASTTEGIYTNGTYSKVTGNIVYNSTTDGIRIGQTYSVCSGNISYSNSDSGIIIVNNYVIVVGNNCYQNTEQGIEVDGAHGSVVGNYAYDNTQSGVHIIDPRCLVSGNYIIDNDFDGVHVTATGDDSFITSNYFYSNGAAGYAGVRVLTNANDVSIRGNYFFQNTDYGVEIEANALRCTVKDNTYQGNVTGAVLNAEATSIFHSASFYCSEADDEHGAVPGKSITNGQFAFVGFDIPTSAQQIMRAELHVIPDATQAAANWDLAADYGATGEAYNTHNETEAAATYNVTQNQNFSIDIIAAGLLAAAVAGDWGGVSITVAAAGHDVTLCFLHLHYV